MPAITGTVVANYLKNVRANGTNGRTLVVQFAKSNMTNAEVNAWINYLTTAHGASGSGDSAFTVAGLGTADGSAFVSGETDNLFLLLQGTGDFTDATVEALTGTPTVTILAVFQDNYL
jgi:hypothetical protein